MEMTNQDLFKLSLNDLMLQLGRYGVFVDKCDTVNEGLGLSIFISVPESSHLTLEDGSEAAGEKLAKYAKQLFFEQHDSIVATIDNGKYRSFVGLVDYNISVKYKVRDDSWTRQREENLTALTVAKLIEYNQKQ